MTPMLPRFLVGTGAYNAHVQQIVLALLEHDALDAYVTSGVDCCHGRLTRALRHGIRAGAPWLDRELHRRAIEVPCHVVETRWHWELPRVLASRLGARRAEDWWWERGELALDAACARRVNRAHCGGFIGVEHGALASLQAARRAGKPGVVAFLSPHHETRRRWLDPEFAADPTLRTEVDAWLAPLEARRDARRDAEAQAADWVVSNSSFTTRSLVDAGVPRAKVITVPLGGPIPVADETVAPERPERMQFLYVGPVSVRKGAHRLLRAWSSVYRRGAELHLYGVLCLPRRFVDAVYRAPGGDAVHFHGSVPATELPSAYRAASVLVFPTLCDGFGLVVSEALAHGLPVITTSNAGAADLLDHGRSGFVIPPADQPALEDQLRWCLDHPAALRAMRIEAVRSARQRTWSQFRDELCRGLAPVAGVGRQAASLPVGLAG